MSIDGWPAGPSVPAIPPRIEDAITCLRESASSVRARVIPPAQADDEHWQVFTRDAAGTIIFKLKASNLITEYGIA